MISDEYDEGMAAYYNSLELEDNPYAHGSVQADDWEQGWKDGEWADAQ